MATFVLVHAAWGGGWEWRRVARVLQRHDHEVFTPTLTGLGERSHLATPGIGPETHIQDVLHVLSYENLTDVIISGHSYGGMVITGVIDRVPERTPHAVYMDGVVPRNGEAMTDLFDKETMETLFFAPARELGDGWRFPFPFGPDHLDMTADDAAWYYPRLVPQPLPPFQQPISLTGRWRSVPAFTYIHCVGNALEDIRGPFIRRAQDAGWRYQEIRAASDAEVTDPERIATLLEDAARTSA